MHRRTRSLLVPVLLAATAQLAAAQTGLVHEIRYDDLMSPSDPDYDEVLAFLHYPPGRGPLTSGFEAAPMPAFLFARGGNSNSLVSGQPIGTDMTAELTAAGFVDVVMNYPVVGPGEDYHVAADGLALLVQYLRHHAVELNLHPDQILLQARSFGVFNAYSVGLGPNRADPLNADPVRRESSRPGYLVPRLGPSTLTCFDETPGPWSSSLDLTQFPNQAFHESTPEQRIAESPTWWLLNPRAVGREFTPALFVLRFEFPIEPCGDVTDVHSGIFGELMLESMDDFAAATAAWDWRARCGDFDKGPGGAAFLAAPAILEWAVERMAEDFGGLWLSQPGGAAGETVTFVCAGAAPGASVAFYSGDVVGVAPVPGCPGLAGELPGATLLGTAVADVDGVCTLEVALPASLAGQTLRYQALDAGGCEVSNQIARAW